MFMEILEILKYVLPSLIVFATAYFIFRLYLVNTQKLELLKLKNSKSEKIDPLRLQAYERMVLFLERISPSSLIMRLLVPGMNADELQSEMVKTIREEFEHNYTQQIYISSQAWEEIRSVREQIVKNIHTARQRLAPNASAQDLASVVLELDMNKDGSPLRVCLEMIKNEARTIIS